MPMYGVMFMVEYYGKKALRGTSEHTFHILAFVMVSGTGGDAGKVYISDNGGSQYVYNDLSLGNSGYLSKEGSSGSYTLSADGKYITVDLTTTKSLNIIAAMKGGDPVGMCQSGETEVRFPMSIYVTSNVLRLYCSTRAGVAYDMTSGFDDHNFQVILITSPA